MVLVSLEELEVPSISAVVEIACFDVSSLIAGDSHILGKESLYESMAIRSMRRKGDGEAFSLLLQLHSGWCPAASCPTPH